MKEPTPAQLARWHAGKDWYHYAIYEGRICERCQRPVPKAAWRDDKLCDNCRDEIRENYWDRLDATKWHPPLDYREEG